MIKHEDPLKSFIPTKNTKFIIFGTMVAINARIIDGIHPKEDFFYYNNNRNHFWRVLQYLMNPKLNKQDSPEKFTIEQKKEFLNKHGIAIINLVKEAIVSNKDKLDPSDTVLFDAYKKNNIRFKKINSKTKELIKTKPIFFTCRKKKGIDLLVDGFFQSNQLDPKIKNNIWYWPTPTRCNPYDRSTIWKNEMKLHTKNCL